MNIPNDLFFYILSFINIEELHNYFCKKTFINYVKYKFNIKDVYANGIYNNLYNNCFLCGYQLTTNFLMNFCSCCNMIINKYPMICDLCSKKYQPKTYGNLIYANCINCDKRSIHLNINFWS